MKCVGFGEKEGKCNNKAGTKWSPYWCEECNQKRLEHIEKQLGDYINRLKAKMEVEV